MGSINDVVDAFGQAPTNVDRGTHFEKSSVRFFEPDPALAQRHNVAWRWIDLPDRKCEPDTVADLLTGGRDTGEYTAIQRKFDQHTHTPATLKTGADSPVAPPDRFRLHTV